MLEKKPCWIRTGCNSNGRVLCVSGQDRTAQRDWIFCILLLVGVPIKSQRPLLRFSKQSRQRQQRDARKARWCCNHLCRGFEISAHCMDGCSLRFFGKRWKFRSWGCFQQTIFSTSALHCWSCHSWCRISKRWHRTPTSLKKHRNCVLLGSALWKSR